MSVESAIFLPLFIVGVLTLGYLIRSVFVAENIFHSLADETRKLSAEATVPVLSLGYKNDLLARLEDENKGEISAVKISPILYRIPYASPVTGRSYTDLIGVSVDYRVDLAIPHIFRETIETSETILSRAFVGVNRSGATKPFSEMMQADDASQVWVFPRSGERYHKASCGYIANEAKETVLTGTLRKNFKACELCRPQESRNGALVYCFPNTGRAYHLQDCYIVARYVVEMDAADARRQGYSACSKCGGQAEIK